MDVSGDINVLYWNNTGTEMLLDINSEMTKQTTCKWRRRS